MAEENMEDTQDNPLEPENNDKITEETTPKEESQKKEYSDLEKRLYARAKKAEEKAKQLESELTKRQTSTAPNIDAIIEATTATAGLDNDEIAELKLRASALGVSLSKAREDKGFNVLLQGLREEKRKANALEPSSRQDGPERKKSLKEMDISEKEEYLRNLSVRGQKVRVLPTWGNPQTPSRT